MKTLTVLRINNENQSWWCAFSQGAGFAGERVASCSTRRRRIGATGVRHGAGEMGLQWAAAWV